MVRYPLTLFCGCGIVRYTGRHRTKGGVKTGKLYLIYKCNKYPKEYMMKVKKTLSLILIGIICGFLGAYSIFSVCQEFDMDYSYESMIKEFNMEEY